MDYVKNPNLGPTLGSYPESHDPLGTPPGH